MSTPKEKSLVGDERETGLFWGRGAADKPRICKAADGWKRMPYRLSHSGLVLSFLRNSDRAQNVAVQPGTTAAQAEIQTFKNISSTADRHPTGWAGQASQQQQMQQKLKQQHQWMDSTCQSPLSTWCLEVRLTPSEQGVPLHSWKINWKLGHLPIFVSQPLEQTICKPGTTAL